MKRLLALLTLVSLALCAGPVLAAQKFPTRPVQVLFPFGPSVTYSVSQVAGEALGQELGQPVSVTSTPGAGGVKAALTVMNKAADGYTIFDGYVAPLVLAPLSGNAKYSHRDFKPLYAVASNAFALVCHKDETRWDDLPGFLRYMKENPGKIVYSSGQDFTLRNLVIVAMLKNEGVVGRKVTYQDATEMKDFLAKEFDVMVCNSGQYKTNKDSMRVLAVLSDQPSPEDGIPGPLPKDYGISLGLSGLAAVGWNWWVVRQDTPDEVVQVLREAMYRAMSKPDTRKKIEFMGFSPLSPDMYSPESYDKVCTDITNQLTDAVGAIEWMNEQVAKLGM